MNLILEKTDQVHYFTNMRLTLQALGISAQDYDWFISDIETNYYGSDFSSNDQWVTGEELHKFLEQNEVQFIWAVFSAFPKGFRTEVKSAPYIEGNPNYWSGKEISTQINEALFEIACWDSSATILIGLPSEAIISFKQIYTDACSLTSVAR